MFRRRVLRVSVAGGVLLAAVAGLYFWLLQESEERASDDERVQELQERLKEAEKKAQSMREEIDRPLPRDGGDLIPSAPQKRINRPDECKKSGKTWDDVEQTCSSRFNGYPQ